MRQIQCDQCGRTLAPSEATTVVCPSCGYAAIVPSATFAGGSASPAFDTSATRPVPPEALAPQPTGRTPLAEQERPTVPPAPPATTATQPASPLGAYVPPSLPRSRADAFAEPIPPGGDPEHDGHGATPTALLRGRDPLHDTRPVDGAVAQAVVAKGMRRSPLTTLSAIALLVVLVLGTTAALLAANGRLNDFFAPFVPTAVPTAAPTATAGPPAPPTGFARFMAADGTYTLVVPTGWTHLATDQLTLFADAPAGVNFEIESLAGHLDPQSVAQDFLSRLDPVPPGTAGTAHVGPLTADSIVVAGIVWTRTEADISVESSGVVVPWRAIVLVTQHGSSTLVIAYFSPRVLFAGENAAHFQVMLDNLMLLSPRP